MENTVTSYDKRSKFEIPELEGTAPFFTYCSNSHDDFYTGGKPHVMRRATSILCYGYITKSGVVIYTGRHKKKLFMYNCDVKYYNGLGCMGRLFNCLFDDEKEQFLKNKDKIFSVFNRMIIK